MHPLGQPAARHGHLIPPRPGLSNRAIRSRLEAPTTKPPPLQRPFASPTDSAASPTVLIPPTIFSTRFRIP